MPLKRAIRKLRNMAKKKRIAKSETKPTQKGEAEYVTMEQFKRDMGLIVEKMREMHQSIKESIDFHNEQLETVAEDVRANEARINKLEDSMEKVSIELEQTQPVTDEENLNLEEVNMGLGKPTKKSKKRVAKEVEPEVEEEVQKGGRPAQTYESCREIAEQLVSLDPTGEGKYSYLPENMRIAAAALGRVVINAFETYEDLEEEFDEQYIEEYNSIVENVEAEE